MDECLESICGKVCWRLFAGALVVHVLYLSQYATTPFFWVPALDPLYHDLLAKAVVAGKTSSEPFFRAPLYYYFLAGVYWVFGHSYWIARLIQAAIGSASCVLLYRFGSRLFRPGVALFAATAMALYGPLVYADGELHTPVLEVFLDLAFLNLALDALGSGEAGESAQSVRNWKWAAAGACSGLSAITRPNALLLAPWALVWLWTRTARPVGRRTRMVNAVVFLAAVLVAPALVTARNYAVSGDRVFIASQGGINLFLGNRPEADGFTPSTPSRYDFAGPYEDSVKEFGEKAASEAAGHPLTASEAQHYWIGRALSWWRESPVAALRLTWKKWVLAWTHQEIRNNTAYDFVRSELAPVLWACPVGFWLAGPLGLLGMLLAWKFEPLARVPILCVLTYVAGFVLFFSADRYRLPMVPLLLLFAAYADFWLAEQARSAEWRAAAPAIVALAVLVLFCDVDWYRTVTPATRALDYWSAGNRYLEQVKLPEAEREYRTALRLDPRNADIWQNLGKVEYGTGQVRDAAAAFQQSIRLQPHSAPAWYDLAMCFENAGPRTDAVRLLEHASQLDPQHEGTREALARLRAD